MANLNWTHAEFNAVEYTIFRNHSHTQMRFDLSPSELNNLRVRFHITYSYNMSLLSAEERIFQSSNTLIRSSIPLSTFLKRAT